ncbi:hypothetical protein like AT3G09510 [Hibiscus trionum]|uniref:RNase H type-1 domain-containing protein n=1 Tax=Hibiscus trionum TaxID=183268 RepID=A0A9W7HWT7_HIBTR|nr:hypothetical protein like AT3G09510 [Hibiscus trionum]
MNSLQSQPPQSLSRIETTWKPPVAPSVKVNFDAGYKVSEKKSSSGILIRDDSGHLLGSCCRNQNGIQNPFAAEALAAVHGLQFALDMGFSQIILEGDARTVIEKLRRPEQDFSHLSALISNGKFLMNQFYKCELSFTHRNGNKAAYVLAKIGLSAHQDTVWVEDAPTAVLLATEKDRQSIDHP